MKRPLRIGLWLLVVLIVGGGLALHLSRDRLVRSLTVRLVEEITGFGVELERVDVRLRKKTVEFTQLRLSNPESFTEREAITIPRIYAELTWDALTGKRTHLPRLEIEVSEVTLIRPRQGLSNLERLAENVERWQEGASNPPAARGEPTVAIASVLPVRRPADAGPAAAAEPEIQIDELRLRLGTVHLVDYKLGRNEPIRLSREVDQEKVYIGVTDLDALSREIAVDFSVDAFASQLAGLEEQFPGLTESVRDLLKGMDDPERSDQENLEQAVDLFKGLFEGL